MDIKVKAYDYYACRTQTFTINGVEADQDLFVDNIDVGGGIQDEWGTRGCSNRVTERYSIAEVREDLPEELQSLTDEEIEKIQEALENELICGFCTDCN